MKKLDKSSWPVLIVSDRLHSHNDEGEWLREIVDNLIEQQHCTALFSLSYSDAHEIVYSREDLGTIVIDWDLATPGNMHALKEFKGMNSKTLKSKEKALAQELVDTIRKRNATIPILILTDRKSIEDIENSVLAKIDGTMWKASDTSQFLAGRIERRVLEYTDGVLPPFFQELAAYVNEYKYAWHTPGHMGGEGFLKSPSGTALHKFFGENVLRADLSISVPELGSLLDHSGLTGDAERLSAKVFGADRTFYILNGTSTANQVIWRSQINPNDKALVDRNCHKSLNYAMVITSADPDYMRPMRNKLGIIGPVDFSKIPKTTYSMSALTNSTYDGVCYNVPYAYKKLSNVKTLHFDEAWYAYAKFHPLYKDHFGMELPAGDKLVFCSQSTHKLLTAFSQASMLHVKLTEAIRKSDEAKERFHALFNESYMMHGSTSPQYNMIASLEIATKMMADNGPVALNDVMEEAVELRKKIASIKKESDWFFGMWQPDCVESVPTAELIADRDYWVIKPKDAWHGFDGLKDEYVMLDPIKLTFTCPGRTVDGKNEKKGIPAAVVTNYLIGRGIVCEKSDYYSWLLLNSLGTTKGKQGTLVAELFKFKESYDANAPLGDVFPELVSQYPDRYKNEGLKDHCQSMHEEIVKLKLLDGMLDAFKDLPLKKYTPAEAYRFVVEGKVEFVELRTIDPSKKKRSAVMLVPYPPGIPIMMGGEEFNEKSSPILKYLLKREEFENAFPGYESDIHGVERTAPDEKGNQYFTVMVIKD